MNKLRLYNVEDDYIEYLRNNIDKRVFSNKEEEVAKGQAKERKYLGVVLNIKDFKYFVPLSSPKQDTDYIEIGGIKKIRKSIVPIMRIVVKNSVGDDELKGTLKFSNMIPVPECALIKYDVNYEVDENYKILVIKELSFIFSKVNAIIKNAHVIYTQKIKKEQINYLYNTVDFLKLEKACKAYEEGKKQKN